MLDVRLSTNKYLQLASKMSYDYNTAINNTRAGVVWALDVSGLLIYNILQLVVAWMSKAE